ncbi:MAG: ATP-dependent Clp protease proteolytic subunit, partial [Thermoproteota archaeon]|nr:ATP-dependent Clp protease proteolytic subunit [Thermoproteota archaeon]
MGKHHNNHQQRPILLLVAVSIALFGLTVVDYTIANPVFAQQQQQDDNGNDSRTILWVDVKDFISSGTAEDISTALQSTSPAAGSSSHTPFSAVILALDTPGGSLDATFDIIDSIQQSAAPVIGYVYPQGKSAWSAGTIILLATDYAAMA